MQFVREGVWLFFTECGVTNHSCKRINVTNFAPVLVCGVHKSEDVLSIENVNIHDF